MKKRLLERPVCIPVSFPIDLVETLLIRMFENIVFFRKNSCFSMGSTN